MYKKPFISTPGFCPKCGTIFPPIGDQNDITCYTCKHVYSAKAVYSPIVKEYTIHFNSVMEEESKEKQPKGAEGPVVEKHCPMCNNDKMSYATVQLRSADEGQTVFYTCTKCNYKESENS